MLADICDYQCRDHAVQIVVVNDEVDRGLISELNSRIELSLVRRPRGSKNLWYALKFLFFIARFRPDIVHAHQLSLIAFIRWLPMPVVSTIHATVFDDTKHIDCYQRLFAISAAVERVVFEKYPRATCRVVSNGVNFSKIVRREAPHKGEFRIVQVGRLELPTKGQDIALAAIAALAMQRSKSKITLDIIGDGPAEQMLKQLAVDLKVETFVRFLGALPRLEIYRLLCEYDLLIQPSRFEGFGLTIIEAMGANVPVLVSDIEGPREVIEGDKYGDSFRSGDALDLARKVLQIEQQRYTPAFAARLDAARMMAISKYNVQNTSLGYLHQYEMLLADNANSARI